jgi:hypothetical protein
MTKIEYNGVLLDSLQEHELSNKNEFGFLIEVVLLTGERYTVQNCTEFHWRYTGLFNPTPCDSVAFESDIHGTGFICEIDNFNNITITDAGTLYEEFLTQIR